MVLKAGAFIFLFALFACEAPSMVDDKTGETSGKKVYHYYCVSCHGPLGKRGAGGASDLSSSELNDHEIRTAILFGNNNGMPSYQSIIKDEEEIKELINYIKTLRE